MSMTLDPPGRPRRGRPPARNEILRAGRLGGLDPRELAERFGTPLYVYDLGVIDRQVAALRAALPHRVDLAYAVKANPALAIVAHLGALGLGADVASGGELATALRAGIPADRIVMTGPGKRDDELRAAVQAGIRAVTVESLGELGRLERVAASEGRRQPVLLRAAVTEGARLERVRLVGDDGAGKFGMDARRPRGLRPAAPPDRAHLELLGLHAFGASNVLDAGALVAHAATTARAARELAEAERHHGSGSSTPAAASGSRTSRTRSRSTWSGLGRGLAAIVDDWPRRPVARRGAAPARARALPGRAGRRLPGARRRHEDRRWASTSRSSMAASITSFDRRWSGQEHRVRLLGSSDRRAAGRAGDRRRAAVLGPGRPRHGRGHGPAIGRRSGRRPRRRRLRLHRVDALLPVASDPGRGRPPRRARGACFVHASTPMRGCRPSPLRSGDSRSSATIRRCASSIRHCHLQADRFDADVDAGHRRARGWRASSGSSSPAGTLSRRRRALELVDRFPWLDAAVGVHPHDAERVDDADWADVAALARDDPRVVAIGETGLDYDRVFSPIPAQLANLRRNLRLAAETGKPAILHCRSAAGRRDAQDALLAELRAFGGDAAAGRDPLVLRPARLRRGDARPRRRDLLLGPRVPARARRRPPRSPGSSPADRLLVETDSPFLSPPGAPRRRNEPEWVTGHGRLGRRAPRPGPRRRSATSSSRTTTRIFAADAAGSGREQLTRRTATDYS